MSNPVLSRARLTYIPFGEKESSERFREFEAPDRIVGINTALNEDDIPTIRLTLRNHDLALFNHPIIAKQTLIGVRFLRENRDSLKYIGFVERVTGGWQVEIEAVDPAGRAHFLPLSEDDTLKTQGKSRKQIIIELAKRLGFEESQISVTTSETPKAEGIVFDEQKTVWEILQDSAEEEGAHIIVLGRDAFIYGPRDTTQKPVSVITIEPSALPETEVRSWSLDDDLLGKRGEVKYKGLILRKKLEVEEKVNRTNSTAQPQGQFTEAPEPDAEGGPPSTEGERITETEVLRVTDEGRTVRFKIPKKTGSTAKERTSAQSKEDIKREADGDFRSENEQQTVLAVTTRFDPEALPGTVVLVEGIGKVYSGEWYQKGVEHSLEGQSASTSRILIRGQKSDLPVDVKVTAGPKAKSVPAEDVEDPRRLKEKLVVTSEGDLIRKFVRR